MSGQQAESVEEQILRMEAAALERWCKGDPTGFLEISAEDVSYFGPFLSHRIQGLAELTRYYESLRARIFAARHEIVEPCVQCAGEAVALAFQFNSWGPKGDAMHWNCTEVYRKLEKGWRIVQTHWSFTGGGDACRGEVS